jgi:cytochrome c-type biogenesis protein CcmE
MRSFRTTGVQVSKGVQIAIAMVSVFGGLAWLISVVGSGEGTFQYYSKVSAFIESSTQPGGISGRGLRVHGFVVEDSIDRDLLEGHVDFRLWDRELAEAQLAVRLIGLDIPDLFKEGAEVVVEGRFENGLFLADRLMAKCPSKYEAKRKAES